MSETSNTAGIDANLSGERCPDCGHRTHKASFDGETWYRCITDSCQGGWYRDTGEEHIDNGGSDR